jgi:hypothetical protein
MVLDGNKETADFQFLTQHSNKYRYHAKVTPP